MLDLLWHDPKLNPVNRQRGFWNSLFLNGSWFLLCCISSSLCCSYLVRDLKSLLKEGGESTIFSWLIKTNLDITVCPEQLSRRCQLTESSDCKTETCSQQFTLCDTQKNQFPQLQQRWCLVTVFFSLLMVLLLVSVEVLLNILTVKHLRFRDMQYCDICRKGAKTNFPKNKFAQGSRRKNYKCITKNHNWKLLFCSVPHHRLSESASSVSLIFKNILRKWQQLSHLRTENTKKLVNSVC